MMKKIGETEVKKKVYTKEEGRMYDRETETRKYTKKVKNEEV